MEKKGDVEQPQFLIYVLFTIVLTLAGIYVALNFLGAVQVKFEWLDYASRINTVTSNLINSPNCFAVEENYTAENKIFHTVNVGKINWTKFNSTESNNIFSKCASVGESEAWAKLTFLDSKVSSAIWTGLTKPNDKQLAEEWKGAQRNVLVLIQNESSTSLGILSVRLKE
jgi:hypothetical protein